MPDYAGHHAIVFGATSGIGAATAMLLAERGANVTVVGRREELGRSVAAKCAQFGVIATFANADIAQDSEVEHALSVAANSGGPVTMAVNNAAIDIAKPLVALTEDDFDLLFNTIARGTWHCLKHEILAMLPNGGGRIVNVTSVGSRAPVPGNALYGASKLSVSALTQYAAAEYASAGIRVNEVIPGSTKTEMLQDWIDMAAADGITTDDFDRTTAMRRLAAPREQATAIAFLLSDDSSYITGESLLVDGGSHLLNRLIPTATGENPPTPGDSFRESN